MLFGLNRAREGRIISALTCAFWRLRAHPSEVSVLAWLAYIMTVRCYSPQALCAFAGAAHLAKLTKSDDTKLSSGPPLLLCQLLLSEQPAPSKARYPPIPPSSTLKISSVFVQLGVVDHFRQHLLEAADQLKSTQSGGAILHIV